MPVQEPGATQEEEPTVCVLFRGFLISGDLVHVLKEMSGKSPDSASTDLVANALAQMAFASWLKLASGTGVPLISFDAFKVVLHVKHQLRQGIFL